MARKKLGDILVEMGAIDALQLRSALAEQRSWGTPLGRLVVEKRFCAPGIVLHALAAQLGLPEIDLDTFAFSPHANTWLADRVARQYRAVPLRREGKRSEVLVIAVAAPATLETLDTLAKATGKRIVPMLAADDAIERALARIYDGEEVGFSAGVSSAAPAASPLDEQLFDPAALDES